MSEIVLAGQDLRLLATRAAVLAELGSTIKWGTRDMIEPVLREDSISLLVLCHTLPIREREELVATAREKSPDVEVLQLVSTIEVQETQLLPGVKIGACDPANLVRRAEELLGESARSRPSAVHGSIYRRAINPDWFNREVNDLGTFEAARSDR